MYTCVRSLIKRKSLTCFQCETQTSNKTLFYPVDQSSRSFDLLLLPRSNRICCESCSSAFIYMFCFDLFCFSFPPLCYPCPTLLCRCPPGHMIRMNGTKKSCVYTLCATRPCHRGTCVAQSPSKFTCHCPEGYRGRHCETALAIYREDVGLSFSSLFAICICFMALLGSSCIHCSSHVH